MFGSVFNIYWTKEKHLQKRNCSGLRCLSTWRYSQVLALFCWVEPCRVKSSTPTVCTLSVEAPGNKIFHTSTAMFKNPELFSLPSLTIALRRPDLPNLCHHSVISLAGGGSLVEIWILQRNLTGKKCYTSFSPEDHLVAFYSLLQSV